MTVMLTETFNRLFANLLERWRAYDETSRDPDRIVDLASAWIALDDARSAVAAERVRHRTAARPAGRFVWRSAVDADTYRLLRLRGVFPEG